MRFSILAFATATSAAAISRRAGFGSWDFQAQVNYPVSGYSTSTIEATYHNSDLPSDIAVSCEWRYIPKNPAHGINETTETTTCTDPSFTFDFGDVRMADTTSNVTLQQIVQLHGETVTVRGSKEFKWDFSFGSGRSGKVAGVIEVTTGIA
ncbi:hypothetical protein CC80DRAFT_487030 [Byssothecium circinans]|uniref:AA1-like domain-containing protein n=1 Tax=Byssothecium circinans TaxID=147558 RepID=A0A6A5UFL2_9PLEO|nr:hypothetical protein CC80DRAFT_487030 [Byssothecium circinans]